MKRPRIVVLSGAATLGIAVAISRAVAPARSAATAADTAITSRSITFFEQRLAGDSHNYMVGGQLVARYLLRFQTGANLADVERAEAVAPAVLPVVSDTAGALARLGVVYLTQHKFAAAYTAARQAAAWNPADQSALGLLFDAAMALGRYPVAESALARLVPGRLPYQLRHAHFLAALGHQDGAHYALDRACAQLERAQLRPQVVAWCVTELAKLQLTRSAGGERAAAALFQRALAFQPGYRGAVEGLADLAYARGDWRRAAAEYRQIAVDAYPDLYLRLAETSRALGDATAAQRYEASFLGVARAPDAEALYAHPLALYYAARPLTRDTALAIARRDVARRPAVESYDVLSWVRFQRGELGEALRASDLARRWGSPSSTMHYHRARILEALGRDAEAAALMRRALAHGMSALEPHVQRELRAPRSRSPISMQATYEGRRETLLFTQGDHSKRLR